MSRTCLTMTILNRARLTHTTEPEPEPAERIAAIARKVRRPATLVAAQEAFRDLQARHSALRDEQRALIAQMQAEGGEAASGTGTGGRVRRIRRLDADLSSLSDTLREALSYLFKVREPFAAAVVSALEPERRSSAKRALAAATALLSEFEVQDLLDRETRSVGGEPAQHPLPQYRAIVEPMIARLRRFTVE
jgi:hypothetical protein